MDKIQNLVFDMDGVLWLGMTPIIDLPPFFAALDEMGIRYAFATNNASRTVPQYIVKMRKMGLTVEPWQILSSAETTASVLAAEYPSGTRAYVVGGDGLHVGLRERGFDIIELPLADNLPDAVQLLSEIQDVEVVVVGFFPQVSYGHLAAASHFINKGARFIGSNPDLSYPTEIGEFPGAGAIIKLVEVATDVTPTIIGKPYPYIFQTALDRLGSTADKTMMVGDRLNTDIAGAKSVNMRSALVLSGVANAEDVPTSSVQPDYVFETIGELLDAIRKSR